MLLPRGFIQTIGPTQLLIVLMIILLLFGSKKLPELARSLGKSLNEFKRGQTETAPEKKIEKQAEPADDSEDKEKPAV